MTRPREGAVRGCLGTVFVALAALAALWYATVELSGEVVDLKTFDAEGLGYDTRLWIVEDAGALWLRAGAPDMGWLERIRARPEVTLDRPGWDTTRYRAVPVPERTPAIHARMEEKYGWADELVGLLGNRDEAVAVRLDPLEPPRRSDDEPLPADAQPPQSRSHQGGGEGEGVEGGGAGAGVGPSGAGPAGSGSMRARTAFTSQPVRWASVRACCSRRVRSALR